jgi:hypothetical protein
MLFASVQVFLLMLVLESCQHPANKMAMDGIPQEDHLIDKLGSCGPALHVSFLALAVLCGRKVSRYTVVQVSRSWSGASVIELVLAVARTRLVRVFPLLAFVRQRKYWAR